MIKSIKVIIDPSAFFRIYQKFTKDVSKRNYMNILLIFCQNSSVAFERDFSTQHCLLVMIEKLRKIRDEKGVFAAVLTDLPKAFDCIPHQLLITKLSAYGFEMKSIAFISAYLKNRKQKTKIGSTFSECLNILFGVQQGSILGPLLFLIFIADPFLFEL